VSADSEVEGVRVVDADDDSDDGDSGSGSSQPAVPRHVAASIHAASE
jgi:hypothetical protein